MNYAIVIFLAVIAFVSFMSLFTHNEPRPFFKLKQTNYYYVNETNE